MSETKRLGDPVFRDHDDRGVDLSLLRYLLGLSPLERLVLMEKHARDTETLYELGRKHPPPTTSAAGAERSPSGESLPSRARS